GDLDTTALGELPANVRTVGWVPLERLLRNCDGAVIHGGGTLLTAIESGTPQLLASDPRDMFQFSGHDAVREFGFGLVSTADQVTPELLTTLIEDDRLKANTLRMREEMLSLPSPAQIAQRIVDEVLEA
ncbi:MAG: nucleotide disphospho-sugar-binding domain-containing protein, partial [Pseudomonadota bacterium]